VTDYVSIRDLAVSAVIGVHPWEREIEQTLVVSVDMAADVPKAAASDDLADALDYSAVAEAIAAVLRDGKFRLIETAAERVAGRLLADFPLGWLRLELRKPIASVPVPHTPPASTVPASTALASTSLAPEATSVTAVPAQDAPTAYTAVITIERTREIPSS
jgi:7,8-dihydroneopterin aldolase/epimerase/oxygenase